MLKKKKNKTEWYFVECWFGLSKQLEFIHHKEENVFFFAYKTTADLKQQI